LFDRQRIRGIIPPLVTPLTPDEQLDEAGLRRLIRKLLNAGIHGIFILGGTGEGVYVSNAVQMRAIEVTADEVAGRAPVLAGVTDLSIKRAIEKGREAVRCGADELISMVPFFRPATQDALYDYFRALAEGASAPVMMYNIPYAVPTNIKEETIARLAEHELIIGMKDSDNPSHVTRVLMLTAGRNFRLLCGIEHDFLAGMLMGAVGGTLATANIWPELTVQAYDANAAGDWPRAIEMQKKINEFTELAYKVPFITATKYALSLQGICGPTLTSAFRVLTEEEKQIVKEWLLRYNLL
jgi:dihydrodipicolinate synthase/N-acetylneuraminate lyase